MKEAFWQLADTPRALKDSCDSCKSVVLELASILAVR
jgi:hypothetical protein